MATHKTRQKHLARSLQVAAAAGDIEGVTQELQHIANLREPDGSGFVALHQAMGAGCIAADQLLLQAETDFYARSAVKSGMPMKRESRVRQATID